jgi:phage-related minor tail protein
MSSKKIKGITIEIGGDTTQLGKAIENSEKQTRSLQGELKEVERLLKFDPTNTELLAQKQNLLTKAVAETTDKLKILEDAEAQVIAQFERGEIGEDQLRAFQREIIKTQNQLDGFDGDLDKLENGFDDVGNSADDATGGFTVFKGALADIVSNVVQGAVSAIGDLVGSLFELSEATEEYRTMQAKLEGSAQTFGYSLDFVNGKYQDFYKYVGDDQMATNAITNLMGIGTTTDSISKIAEGAIGVWASYGDSIPIESLTESINETITVGKVTGTMADTINWAKDANENLGKALEGNKDAQKAYNDALNEGLPVEDAFNEALAKITDEQERADVVAQFLNSTYGESKKAYDELNKSVTDANEAELALKDTQAELGETIAPVNNELTNLKNQALEAILPLVEDLADAFMDLVTWLRENPVAMQILTAIVIALATAFSVLAGALAIQALITGVTKAFALLNTTMLANPITLIVALLAGLVAGFMYLWKTNEDFRNFWIDLWNTLKKTVNDVVDAIVEFFEDCCLAISKAWDDAWTEIKNLVDTWSGYFSDIWSNIKDVFGDVKNWFSDTFTSAWSSVKEVFSDWGDFFGGLWTTIQNKFSAIGTKIAGAISDAVKSGVNGVISAIESTINKGIGLINGAIDLINKLPGVSVGKIDTLSFPRLEKGGIVDRATFAEIGENGREAVIPLEKNLGWLDQLARQLTERMALNPGLGDGAVLSKLDDIYNRLDRMQIILDTGTLIGETIDKIDAGLADRQLLSARGV